MQQEIVNLELKEEQPNEGLAVKNSAKLSELREKLEKAVSSGQFLITVTIKEGDRLDHYYNYIGISKDDFIPSLEALKNDFSRNELARIWR